MKSRALTYAQADHRPPPPDRRASTTAMRKSRRSSQLDHLTCRYFVRIRAARRLVDTSQSQSPSEATENFLGNCRQRRHPRRCGRHGSAFRSPQRPALRFTEITHAWAGALRSQPDIFDLFRSSARAIALFDNNTPAPPRIFQVNELTDTADLRQCRHQPFPQSTRQPISRPRILSTNSIDSNTLTQLKQVDLHPDGRSGSPAPAPRRLRLPHSHASNCDSWCRRTSASAPISLVCSMAAARTLWTDNGSAFAAGSTSRTVTWAVMKTHGVGDFNGDGNADLLWTQPRRTGGRLGNE